MKVKRPTVIIVPPEDEPVFKVRPKPGVFKVRRIPPEQRQRWHTPIPKEKVISIRDLNPDQEYATERYFPNNGGYRTVVASGAALQRSWANAYKKRHKPDGLDRFMAAFFRRPTNRCKVYHEPLGRWREVILHPRRDLYFSVQPVNKKWYQKRK